MSVVRVFNLILIFSLSFHAAAQEPQFVALTFQSWKEQQVLEAQNQMLRVSTRINQLKSGKSGAAENKQPVNLPSARIKKTTESDQLQSADKDLKRAQESLETANSLQFEDYINIYIPTLQDQPEALAKLTQKLTKEELMEVVKSLVKKAAKPSDTKRNNGTLLDGLAVTSRLKAP